MVWYLAESLNQDFAFYRGLDPVLGVWMHSLSRDSNGIDPKAEQVIGMCPYCAMDDRLMRSKIVIRNHDLRRELCNTLHSEDKFSQMDPDGDLPFLAVVGIAFARGVTTNGISNINKGENFWSNGFSAGLWSAASATVTFGIGDVFGGTGSLLKEFGRAGAHSLASGTFSHLQGDRLVTIGINRESSERFHSIRREPSLVLMTRRGVGYARQKL